MTESQNNTYSKTKPSESAIVLMQAICDTLISLKKETERNLTLSMVGMAAASIFCICGVILCEVMFFHGNLDLTTTMLLNALCVFLSYFCTGHFYSAHDLAKRKYTDLLSVIARGVTVTSEMEKDFENGKSITVNISPCLNIIIDSFPVDEWED